jgi:hypothetical protein
MSDNFDNDFGDISKAVRRAIQEAQNQGFVAVVISDVVGTVWWQAVAEMLSQTRQDLYKGRS